MERPGACSGESFSPAGSSGADGLCFHCIAPAYPRTRRASPGYPQILPSSLQTLRRERETESGPKGGGAASWHQQGHGPSFLSASFSSSPWNYSVPGIAPSGGFTPWVSAGPPSLSSLPSPSTPTQWLSLLELQILPSTDSSVSLPT